MCGNCQNLNEFYFEPALPEYISDAEVFDTAGANESVLYKYIESIFKQTPPGRIYAFRAFDRKGEDSYSSVFNRNGSYDNSYSVTHLVKVVELLDSCKTNETVLSYAGRAKQERDSAEKRARRQAIQERINKLQQEQDTLKNELKNI